MKRELKIGAVSGVDAILNRDDIVNELGKFQENELEQTRFLLLIGIREDGSVFCRRVGFVSDLELDGLKIAIENMCDETSDELVE